MDERAGNVVERADVGWSLVDERVVIGGPAGAALDPVSSVLWRCLDGVSPLSEVVADVAEAFDIPLETALTAFVPVVDSWIERSFVTQPAATDAEHGSRWRRLTDPPDA